MVPGSITRAFEVYSYTNQGVFTIDIHTEHIPFSGAYDATITAPANHTKHEKRNGNTSLINSVFAKCPMWIVVGVLVRGLGESSC